MANTIQLNNDGSIGQDITDLGNMFTTSTISGGAITYSGTLTTVNTEANTPSDDLTLIANGGVGKFLILKSANAARIVTLRHEASGGNIYHPSGLDVELTHPNQIVLLMYNGSRWVILSCCGGVSAVTPLDPEAFDDPVCCVAATRIMAFINEVVDIVKANITLSALAIVGQISPLFATVGAGNDKTPLMITLANSFKAAYSTSGAIDADFDSTVYETLLGLIYCSDAGCNGVYATSELLAIAQGIALESGAAYPFLAQIIQILGVTGMNNAVGVMSHITTGDCSGFECDDPEPCVDGCCYILGGYGLQGNTYTSADSGAVYDPVNDTLTCTTSVYGSATWINLVMDNITPGWTSCVVEFDRAVTRIAASANPTNTGYASRGSSSGAWSNTSFPMGGTVSSPIADHRSAYPSSGGGSYLEIRLAAGNLAANSALIRIKRITFCYP